jgi:hypothetical protein
MPTFLLAAIWLQDLTSESSQEFYRNHGQGGHQPSYLQALPPQERVPAGDDNEFNSLWGSQG